MSRRVPYLGASFDPLDMGAVIEIARTTEATTPARMIVTPNVDHLVRLDAATDPRVRDAYAAADLTLCDSRIVAKLAAIDGIALPVVPGSDLTARILDEVVRPGDQIAIVGGDDETAAALRPRLPDIELVQHRPPMGMRRNPQAMAAAADFVVGARARFTFLAVGSPQQELLALAVKERGGAGGLLLCIGASIDFLTGRAKRAPGWMQRAHVEWLHRLASDPARMWRRYLVEGPRILAIRRRWKKRSG